MDSKGKTIGRQRCRSVSCATVEAAAKVEAAAARRFWSASLIAGDGHFGGDPGTAYRSKEEIEAWKLKCPIRRLKEHLIQEGNLTEAEFQKMSDEVYADLDAVAKRAEAAPAAEKGSRS
jgi:TPP-dependent pyruvate/acetoin dehydrogenase alpha subunit